MSQISINPGNRDLIIEKTILLEFLDIDDPMSIVIETIEDKNDLDVNDHSENGINLADENTENIENNENPLDAHRTAGSLTVLMTMLPSREEITIIAPGEGLTPLFILSDPHCEELAYPHLFPTGKYGYQVKRNILLSPVKYFNQRLLNYTQNFASDSYYIFFAHFVLLKLHLNNQINITMRKVAYNSLTERMHSKNFIKKVKSSLLQTEHSVS